MASMHSGAVMTPILIMLNLLLKLLLDWQQDVSPVASSIHFVLYVCNFVLYVCNFVTERHCTLVLAVSLYSFCMDGGEMGAGCA